MGATLNNRTTALEQTAAKAIAGLLILLAKPSGVFIWLECFSMMIHCIS